MTDAPIQPTIRRDVSRTVEITLNGVTLLRTTSPDGAHAVEIRHGPFAKFEMNDEAWRNFNHCLAYLSGVDLLDARGEL